MSRFDGDYDENFPGEWALWDQARRQAFSGKRGQAKLRELREAILALPEPRLIYSRLADATGGVCAMGALAVHALVKGGADRNEAIQQIADSQEEDDDGYIDTWEMEQQTRDLATVLGMPQTMAVDIAWHNDLRYSETDEERYTRVLAWLNSVIKDPAPA